MEVIGGGGGGGGHSNMSRENNCFKMYGGISGPLDPPMIHQALCCLCLILPVPVLSMVSQSGSYQGGGVTGGA